MTTSPFNANNRAISITRFDHLSTRPSSDVLVIPCWQGERATLASHVPQEWHEIVEQALDAKDFTGKSKQTCMLYAKGERESRLCLLGLGKEETFCLKSWYEAFFAFGSYWAQQDTLQSIALPLPVFSSQDGDQEHLSRLRHVVAALSRATYAFLSHKSEQSKPKKLHIALMPLTPSEFEILEAELLLCQATDFSRDLINTSADEMKPVHLAQAAEFVVRTHRRAKLTVLKGKQLKKENLSLLSAVGQGCSEKTEPHLIALSYQGDRETKESHLLVGKGVTYDSGGMNLKPTGFNETMKCDMGGAAIVLSTFYAALLLDLPINLHCVIPATENAIGPDCFKPGDVHKSHQGLTVEIGNTDAEGRLILADAISWAQKKFAPSTLIDVATLTGACVVALGSKCAGLFTEDTELESILRKASQESLDALWPLPLFDDYESSLDSSVADICNISSTREAGATIAALFLRKFVTTSSWAHLDVAGVAFGKSPNASVPKMATGYGVRLLVYALSQKIS